MSACDTALKVFLVEDHVDTLVVLRRYLEHLGCEVQCASQMEEALRLLPTGNWDVLMSDLGLPDGNGWELLRKANLPESTYTVAISGFGTLEDRTRSMEAGYRHHLLKPFAPEELESCLQEAALAKKTTGMDVKSNHKKTQHERVA